MITESGSASGLRDLNNKSNSQTLEILCVGSSSSIVVMLSQVLAPVLIGLVGLIDVSFAQSCAAQW
jgi:hypothetical protein